MNWSQPIDAYCERLGPGFWAEPLNAVSNAAFFAAAAVGLVLWYRGGRSDRPLLFLCLLVGVIGVGSFLFHTFANRWSALADVLPIAVFIAVYFGLALVRFFGVRVRVAVPATLAFLAASSLTRPALSAVFGSSAAYVPALLALAVIGGIATVFRVAGGGLVLAAALAFAVSIGFRMADMPLCPSWPPGTHFLWHVLNGLTLGLLLVAISVRGQATRFRSIPSG